MLGREVNTGDPKGRYSDSLRSFPSDGTFAIHGFGCANLGHVVDDESNLIYMRARYYDPTPGRFLSEDRQHQGTNWLLYCNGDPLNAIDYSGQSYAWMYLAAFGILLGAVGVTLAIACEVATPIIITMLAIAAIIEVVVAIHEFDETMSDFNRVLGPHLRKIENLDGGEGFLVLEQAVNYDKTNGGIGAKIAACDFEILMYLAAC